jgi:glycolate oxidase
LSLGGTITDEDVIVLSKMQYLEIALVKRQIEIMRSIKKIFDPKNILNPGKIFTNPVRTRHGVSQQHGKNPVRTRHGVSQQHDF